MPAAWPDSPIQTESKIVHGPVTVIRRTTDRRVVLPTSPRESTNDELPAPYLRYASDDNVVTMSESQERAMIKDLADEEAAASFAALRAHRRSQSLGDIFGVSPRKASNTMAAAAAAATAAAAAATATSANAVGNLMLKPSESLLASLTRSDSVNSTDRDTAITSPSSSVVSSPNPKAWLSKPNSTASSTVVSPTLSDHVADMSSPMRHFAEVVQSSQTQISRESLFAQQQLLYRQGSQAKSRPGPHNRNNSEPPVGAVPPPPAYDPRSKTPTRPVHSRAMSSTATTTPLSNVPPRPDIHRAMTSVSPSSSDGSPSSLLSPDAHSPRKRFVHPPRPNLHASVVISQSKSPARTRSRDDGKRPKTADKREDSPPKFKLNNSDIVGLPPPPRKGSVPNILQPDTPASATVAQSSNGLIRQGTLGDKPTAQDLERSMSNASNATNATDITTDSRDESKPKRRKDPPANLDSLERKPSVHKPRVDLVKHRASIQQLLNFAGGSKGKSEDKPQVQRLVAKLEEIDKNPKAARHHRKLSTRRPMSPLSPRRFYGGRGRMSPRTSEVLASPRRRGRAGVSSPRSLMSIASNISVSSTASSPAIPKDMPKGHAQSDARTALGSKEFQKVMGNALRQAKGFRVLSYDDVQKLSVDQLQTLQKTHLPQLSRKYSHESSKRNKSIAVLRSYLLSTGNEKSGPNSSLAAQRKVMRHVASTLLPEAVTKVDGVASELWTANERLGKVRTLLLEHVAACLGVGIARMDKNYRRLEERLKEERTKREETEKELADEKERMRQERLGRDDKRRQSLLRVNNMLIAKGSESRMQESLLGAASAFFQGAKETLGINTATAREELATSMPELSPDCSQSSEHSLPEPMSERQVELLRIARLEEQLCQLASELAESQARIEASDKRLDDEQQRREDLAHKLEKEERRRRDAEKKAETEVERAEYAVKMAEETEFELTSKLRETEAALAQANAKPVVIVESVDGIDITDDWVDEEEEIKSVKSPRFDADAMIQNEQIPLEQQAKLLALGQSINELSDSDMARLLSSLRKTDRISRARSVFGRDVLSLYFDNLSEVDEEETNRQDEDAGEALLNKVENELLDALGLHQEHRPSVIRV